MRHIVRFTEIAADFGGNTKNGEKVVGHAPTTDAFRFDIAASARQISIIPPNQGQIGETALSGAPVELIWETNGTGVKKVRALADKHEPIRLRIREWPQKDRVNDAKDRRVGPDSERKR